MTSGALWLPLAWLAIVTSRPVSRWFDSGMHVVTPADYLEGSPLDRNVYLALMLAGLVVLFRRNVDWGKFFAWNRWLMLFFLYCAMSIVWSDFPFVGFKRIIKDLGNVVMVLVVLTEKDQAAAIRALLARCTYLMVPFSILTIKYYGDIGRYVTSSWENGFCGLAVEKNSLGCLALFAGIFLVWDFMTASQDERIKGDKKDKWGRIVLLLMVLWLIDKAESSTALVCLVMGSGILLFLRTKFADYVLRRLEAYVVTGTILVVAFIAIPGVKETFLDMLGEDMTLTGRTELWGELLNESINPLLGVGYQSFWMGKRAEVYWEKWAFHPNQAHNGYLETYLGGGFVGLGLLLIVLFSTMQRLKFRLLAGKGHESLLFACFAVIIFYNWTEAMFNKMTSIWFIQLLATVAYPARALASRDKVLNAKRERAAFKADAAWPDPLRSRCLS